MKGPYEKNGSPTFYAYSSSVFNIYWNEAHIGSVHRISRVDWTAITPDKEEVEGFKGKKSAANYLLGLQSLPPAPKGKGRI